jgi:hypothetical protein
VHSQEETGDHHRQAVLVPVRLLSDESLPYFLILLVQGHQGTLTLGASRMLLEEDHTRMAGGDSLSFLTPLVVGPLINVLQWPETEDTPSSPCNSASNVGWVVSRMSQGCLQHLGTQTTMRAVPCRVPRVLHPAPHH